MLSPEDRSNRRMRIAALSMLGTFLYLGACTGIAVARASHEDAHSAAKPAPETTSTQDAQATTTETAEAGNDGFDVTVPALLIGTLAIGYGVTKCRINFAMIRQEVLVPVLEQSQLSDRTRREFTEITGPLVRESEPDLRSD